MFPTGQVLGRLARLAVLLAFGSTSREHGCSRLLIRKVMHGKPLHLCFQTICNILKTVLGVVLCLQAEDNSDYLYNLF